jgi:hypothetical protein
MKKNIKYILFIIVYFVVLTFLLLHPKYGGDIMPAGQAVLYSLIPMLRGLVSLLHFIAFLPLAFCVSQICGKRTIWIGFILLLFYAVLTELLQEFIPPRAFRYEDLTQNIAGIIVGLFFGYYLKFVREDADTIKDNE